MNEEDRKAFKLTQQLASKKYKTKKKNSKTRPVLLGSEAKQIAGVWKERQAYYKQKNKELGL